MDPLSSRYKARLDQTSALTLIAIAILPLMLAYGLGGGVWAVSFMVAVVLLGLLRTRGAEALAGTFLLEPHEAPGLFVLVESLARRAGLKRLPEIRIVVGGQANAAATLRGQWPVLIVTEALLARLDTRHLGAVLAHETTHLAERDLFVFRLARTLEAATLVLSALTAGLAGFTSLIDPATSWPWLLFSLAAPLTSRWLLSLLSRTREFAADLGAVRLTGDPGALADALELVEYRPLSWWQWWRLKRVNSDREAARDAFRTHPPTSERVRRLELLARWAS